MTSPSAMLSSDKKLMRCTCPGSEYPWEIEETVDTIGHAWNCTSVNCPYSFCKRMKKRIAKTKECMHNMYDATDCELCKDMAYFLDLHSDECVEVECEVFGCKNNKKDELGIIMVRMMKKKIHLESNTSQVIPTRCSLCADDTKTVQSSQGEEEDLPRKESHDEHQRIESGDQSTKVLPRKESTDERQRERIEYDDQSKKVLPGNENNKRHRTESDAQSKTIFVKIKKTVAVDVSNSDTIDEIKSKVQKLEGIASNTGTVFTISVPEIAKLTSPKDFLEA